MEDAFTIAHGKRPGGAATRVAARDMRGQSDGSQLDRRAVLEPVIDSRRGISDDSEPGQRTQRDDHVAIVATGGDDSRARLARPYFGTRRLLEDAQPASMIGVRLGVNKHLHIFDVKAESSDARHDHPRRRGIAGIEQHVTFGPVIKKAATSFAPT
jgi:hypothetical protein